MYEQLCTTGQSKSIGVIVGTIVLIAIVGTICCCQNRVIAKKLRKLELDMIKEEKKKPESATAVAFKTKMADLLGKKYS